MTEERHIGTYVDAHSDSVSSGEDCMLEYTTPFPILAMNLPVAMPSHAFSLPVLSLGSEPEQLRYADGPLATATHFYWFKVALDQKVGLNSKRCIGCSIFLSLAYVVVNVKKLESQGKNALTT